MGRTSFLFSQFHRETFCQSGSCWKLVLTYGALYEALLNFFKGGFKKDWHPNPCRRSSALIQGGLRDRGQRPFSSHHKTCWLAYTSERKLKNFLQVIHRGQVFMSSFANEHIKKAESLVFQNFCYSRAEGCNGEE